MIWKVTLKMQARRMTQLEVEQCKRPQLWVIIIQEPLPIYQLRRFTVRGKRIEFKGSPKAAEQQSDEQ